MSAEISNSLFQAYRCPIATEALERLAPLQGLELTVARYYRCRALTSGHSSPKTDISFAPIDQAFQVVAIDACESKNKQIRREKLR